LTFDQSRNMPFLPSALHAVLAQPHGISRPPVVEWLSRLETSLLFSLLLPQLVNSGPTCSHEADTVCCFAISAKALNACGDAKGHLPTVLPAGTPPQPMLLSLSTAQQQYLAGKGQLMPQKQLSQQQQQQQQPESQFLVVLPSAIAAEMLPLLIKLCKARMLLLGDQHQPAAAAAAAAAGVATQSPASTASASPAQQAPANKGQLEGFARLQFVRARSHASLVAGLLAVCAISVPRDQAAVVGSHNSTPAAETAEQSRVAEPAGAAATAVIPPHGTPAGPHTDDDVYLHPYHVFAAHAADVTSTLESLVRFVLSCSAGLGGDEGSIELPLHLAQQMALAAGLLGHQAGPGSAELQHSYSLFASVLRLGAALRNPRSAAVLSCSAATGAESLLAYTRKACQPGADQQQPAQQQQPRVPIPLTAIISSLPSMVVMGCYFLQVAQQLGVQAAPDTQQQEVLDVFLTGMATGFGLVNSATTAQRWLQAYSTQLAAAGYLLPPLQQLQQLLPALKVMTASSPAATSSSTTAGQSSAPSSSNRAAATSTMSIDEALTAALQQLRQTGFAVCSMAVPCLCNNPACSNTSGPTELSLVSGRSCVCGGCRVADYCSRACQAQHWKQHKPVCMSLAAAAAAAGAPAGLPAAS
jgi:hypothetical protein